MKLSQGRISIGWNRMIIEAGADRGDAFFSLSLKAEAGQEEECEVLELLFDALEDDTSAMLLKAALRIIRRERQVREERDGTRN